MPKISAIGNENSRWKRNASNNKSNKKQTKAERCKGKRSYSTLSTFLACNFTKDELLQKSFQGFFLDYRSILFAEKHFMGHSWQRVPNIPCYEDPLYWLYHRFKTLSKPSFLLPPTFTSTAIFYVLFLWVNGPSCHIWRVISFNDIMMCYFT